MNVRQASIPGVLTIEPRIFGDDRGSFLETFQAQRYAAAGLSYSFVQDNQSTSTQGVLRGLHYQLHHPQGKLVMVNYGMVFDVAVDIRQGSPTFGQWFGTTLTAIQATQVFIPPGFAHGFCVLSDVAIVTYKCTEFYHPGDEYAIAWDDPQLAIDWPVTNPQLSSKDQQAPFLKDAVDDLPQYSD